VEKLLSEQYKKQNRSRNSLTGQQKKRLSLAMEATKVFLPTHGKKLF